MKPVKQKIGVEFCNGATWSDLLIHMNSKTRHQVLKKTECEIDHMFELGIIENIEKEIKDENQNT